MDWRFQGGKDLRADRLALNCRIQEIGEGMKVEDSTLREVEFAGLERLKGKDLLWIGEEIDAIRRYSSITTSRRVESTTFPLNKVDDEPGDFRSPNDNKPIWVFDSFFPYGEGNLDDK